MNIEREKAYTFFEAAVAKDPSLFAPHVALANLSWGDVRRHHIAEAKRLVEGKDEVSKLFVSLLDVIGRQRMLELYGHAIWKKMYELAHDGALFVNYKYARSIPDLRSKNHGTGKTW